MSMLPFYYNIALIILENDVVMRTTERIHMFSTYIIMEKYAWLQGSFSLGMNRESLIMFIFPKIDSQKIMF
jgi:predicted amidohydrolase